jgi:predicted  nucleic acid-binding Zn-ribbon protein
MPTTTIEKLNARAARLKKKLAEKAATLDPAKVRDLKKRVRRAQRRRRKMTATAARVAGKAGKKTE